MITWLKHKIPSGWKLRAKVRRHHGRWRLATPDRVLLEDTIIPWFTARGDVRRVLDIGVDWYTGSYPRLFSSQNFWTVDIDPSKRRYATRQHHTASMTDLATVFPGQFFDLVLCNGVFGWGIQSPGDVSCALRAAVAVLRPGGWLVAGWNDHGKHSVPHLLSSARIVLEPFVHPAVGSESVLTETSYRHRYDFFRKGVAGS